MTVGTNTMFDDPNWLSMNTFFGPGESYWPYKAEIIFFEKFVQLSCWIFDAIHFFK